MNTKYSANNIICKISILLVLLCSSLFLNAQTFDFKTRDASVVKTATQIKAHNGFNDTIIVRQDKWYEMVAAGSGWGNNLKFKSTHAFVKFYVDHAYPVKIPTSYKFRLTYKIYGYGNMADTTAYTTDTDTLTIGYSPDSLSAFQDIQFKKYSDYHKIMIVLTGLYEISSAGAAPVAVNMTTGGGMTRLNFNVEGSIVVQPYHKRVLSGGSYVGVYGTGATALTTGSDAPVNDYLPVRWALSGGSLTTPIELTPVKYELEWTYVDDYAVNPATGAVSTAAATSLKYDFQNNSTRVWLDTNYYRIPLTYQKGWVLYRVRMVRPDSVGYRYPVYGNWSLATATGIVSAVASSAKRQITTAHISDSLNWQYTVSFAEEGKFKHVMSYYDGMLKNRQSITRFNSTPTRLIATEQIYDYEGRPSISILPTPVTASNFRHQRNLSINSLTTLPYKAADFDYLLPGGFCPKDSVPSPLSNIALANVYYSALNLDKSGFQKFVPDAGGYPFVQTIYSPGYEDRVDKQGGAGDTLQIGRNHTVKNDYVGGDQMDLNRTFGLNIGWAGFYKKTVSKDPNGQFSLNVTDYKGKTVASSMVGIPDTMKHALVPNENAADTSSFKEDFIAGTEQSKSGNKIILDKNFFNDAAGNNTAQYIYNFTPYPTFCPGTYLSVKSAYKYTMADECGVVAVSDSGVLGTTGAMFTATPVAYSGLEKSFYMNQGKYMANKVLTINFDEIDAAIDSFFVLPKAKNCLKTEREFVREEVMKKDFPCPPKPTRDCDMIRRMALDELYPNLDSVDVTRKYGYYTSSGGSNSNSIFTLMDGGSRLKRRYQDDCVQFPDTIWYKGFPITNIKELSLDSFVMIFNDTIAEALLPLHPEYCALLNCFDDVYLKRLNKIPDAPVATALGLFTPGQMIAADPVYTAMVAAPALFPSPIDTLMLYTGGNIHDIALEQAYCSCGDSVMFARCKDRIYKGELTGDVLTESYVREKYYQAVKGLYKASRSRYTYLLAPGAVNCDQCKPIRMTLDAPPLIVTGPGFGGTGTAGGGGTTGGASGVGGGVVSGTYGMWLEDSYEGASDIVEDYIDMVYDEDSTAAIASATASYAAMSASLTTGAANGIVTALVNCADSVTLLKVRDTLLAMHTSGIVMDGMFSPQQVRYAITSNGIAIGDLCNEYLANYDYISPTMAVNTGDFACPSPTFMTHARATLNAAPLNALKSLGTEFTATFSATNLFQAKVITKLGGTAMRMKASYDAPAKLYTVNIYRTGVADTVKVCFQADASGSCATVFSTTGGATMTFADVRCTKDADEGFPVGYVGINTFNVTVARTVGAATTNCSLPAWTEKVTFNNVGGNKLAECVPCTQLRTLYKEFMDTLTVDQVKGVDHPYYSTMLRNFMNYRLQSSFSAGQYSEVIESCAFADSMALPRYIAYASLEFNTTSAAVNAGTFVTALNSLDPDVSVSTYTTGTTSAMKVLIDFNSIPKNKLRIFRNFVQAYTAGVATPLATYRLVNVLYSSTMGQLLIPSSSTFTPVTATIFGAAPYGFTFSAATTHSTIIGTPAAVSYKSYTVSAPAGSTPASINANTFALIKYLQNNGVPGVFLNAREYHVNGEYNLADKKEYLKYVYKYQPQSPSNVLDSLQESFLLARIAAYSGKKLGYAHPGNRAAINNLYIGESTATVGTNFGKVNYILDKMKAYLPGDAIFFHGLNTRNVIATATENLTAYKCGDNAFWYRYFGADDTLFNIFVRIPEYIDTLDFPGYNLTSVTYNLGEGDSRSISLTLTNPAKPLLPLKLDAYTDFTVAKNKVLRNVVLANPLLSDIPETDTVLNCERIKLNSAIYEGKVRYKLYIDSVRSWLRNDFYAYLMGGGIKEQLLVGYRTQRFNYTLYYYDRAGNLMRTIPPAGVTMLSPTLLGNVNTNRTSGAYSSSLVNNHKKPSNYLYNTIDQVVEQTTPDGGRTEYFYDAAGRVIFSQNAKQRPIGKMTYTLYDKQGRIVETGQAKIACEYFAPYNTNVNVPPKGSCEYLDPNLNQVTPFPAVVYNLKRIPHEDVIAHVRSLTREEVVFTHYDTAAIALGTNSGMSAQENLRKRVSSIKYFDYLHAFNTTFSRWTYAMHFSYDIAGNVKTLTRDYPGLKTHNQQFKRVDYDYDVISGKVNMLSYNRGFADQYYQRYGYDDDNRITKVESSPDGYIWDRDAAYEYYQHGPLGRMSVGDRRVQGVDYAYTIQGWLKSVNGDLLDTAKDMGGDAKYTSVHAQDAVALTLDYFKGDYKPIGTTAVTNVAAPAKSLYNGNIPRANTAIYPFTQNLNTRYTYDQLNRIVKAEYANTAATATLTNTADYYSSYAYDPDGNLKKLVRNGNKPATQKMDSLVYRYISGGSDNKLLNVADYVANNYENDIRQFATLTATRYQYDPTGNVIKDQVSGQDTIQWNHYNKVTQTRSDTAGGGLRFNYDGAGNRYIKNMTRTKVDTVTEDMSYYVRDAQGNILAVYDIDTRSEKKKAIWIQNITSDILSVKSTTDFATYLIGPAYGSDGFFSTSILASMNLSTSWRTTRLNATPVSYFVKNNISLKNNTLTPATSYSGFFSAMSAWTRASSAARPLLAGAVYRWQEPQPNGGGQQLASITVPMINASGTPAMKKHVVNLMCGSDNLLRTAMQQMGYPWNSDSSCTFNTTPLVNGQPNFSQFYSAVQSLGNTPPYQEEYWSFIERLSKDSLVMNFAAYTGQGGQLIAPFQNALVAYSNDSLLGNFFDSWTPARTMMNTGNTTAAQLAVLYNADPTPVINSYATTVTGGVDSIKKALGTMPWLTASEYLTSATASLSGYIIGPAVLANTLKFHKIALGSHHLYGSSRLGTKDYLPGQYYRLRDYTPAIPVIDTITLATRKPWFSMEYNDAISSLSLSPYGNTQKGKYFLDRLIGMKQYELSNHLGNVQATVTDYPVSVIVGAQGNNIGYRRPAFASAYDYYPFGMLMPGRYVSDTTSKCVTVTQTKWVSNWNIKPWILSEWPWPGYVVVGSATVSTSQILTTTTPVGSSISFTFESAATLENVAQLNIASVSGVPRVSILETLPTGVEVELTSFVPNVAGTFNLSYTPTQSEVKVKILGTGGSTSIIGWHNLQIWKPQMVQEEVLVDICEKDNDRYMFGFNGMEKDNEMKGIGNSLDFGARMLDSRVGKWLAMDPLAGKYPSMSPYSFSLNSPISKNDPNGKEAEATITRNPNGGGTIQMSSTVFIHGADAARVVAESQAAFDKWGAKGGTSSDGKWEVQIQMTFKVAGEEDIERISKQANEESGENLMYVTAGEGRANAGGGAGASYLAGPSIDVPSKDYPGKTMKVRTADAPGNTARLFSADIRGGHVPIHENLHLMGLGDRYTDNLRYQITVKQNGNTTTSPGPILQGVEHEGFEGDIMSNGWGFSKTHVDNLVESVLKTSIEKNGSDNFYMGRQVDNSSRFDASAVPQTRKESGETWEKTYSNPTVVK